MPNKKLHGRYQVYLLECADGTYYAGSAKDLNARIKLHNAGKGAKYVRGRTPARLIYARLYRSLGKALRAEAGLKKLTRKQKEGLVKAYENEFFLNPSWNRRLRPQALADAMAAER